LQHLLSEPAIHRAIVFTRTKRGADRVSRGLARASIQAEAIHGNKSQNARERVLHQFKTGSIRVLVATDIAARGIDVDSISHVVNYELPDVPETYVHRIGRTARAGATGAAFSFCDPGERPLLRDIERLIRMNIPVVEDHPFGKGAEGASRPHGGYREGAVRGGGNARGNGERRGSEHPRGGERRGGEGGSARGRGEDRNAGNARGGSSNGRSGGGARNSGGARPGGNARASEARPGASAAHRGQASSGAKAQAGHSPRGSETRNANQARGTEREPEGPTTSRAQSADGSSSRPTGAAPRRRFRRR
jgi:ATP-dependent RNA helicase RhlE